MKLIIEGGVSLRGELRVPADKSITHRALILGALGAGETRVEALAPGADNFSTARIVGALGAEVSETEKGWTVRGGELRAPAAPLDCGNSGTTMRLMAGVLAGANVRASLTGDESLSVRPMGRVCGPLRELGATIAGAKEGDKELPPIDVEPGDFAGGRHELRVASAQVKSALILAGVCAGKPVVVVEPEATRDHTERMLRAMGVAISERGSDGTIVVPAHSGELKPLGTVRVPGDFSSAAFWLALGTLVEGSRVQIHDVGLNAARTGLLEIFEEYGAGVLVSTWREEGGEPVGTVTAEHRPLMATQSGERPTVVGGDVIPRMIDELVVLAAVASQAEGVTEIRDAAELRFKESDRIAETARVLEAFGVTCETSDDGLRVRGPQPLRGASLDVSSDHRVALTAAVLACAAKGTSELTGFNIANVSYPGFAKALESLGAKVRVEDA